MSDPEIYCQWYTFSMSGKKPELDIIFHGDITKYLIKKIKIESGPHIMLMPSISLT